MSGKDIHPLIAVVTITLLSLLVAGVLFGVLTSTGSLRSDYLDFGGAAAGFLACLLVLSRWYGQQEEARRDFVVKSDDLRKWIANGFAREIVRDAEGDPIALTTGYNAVRASLRSHFNTQGQDWLKALDQDFQSGTLAEARGVPGLRTWVPDQPSVGVEAVSAPDQGT